MSSITTHYSLRIIFPLVTDLVEAQQNLLLGQDCDSGWEQQIDYVPCEPARDDLRPAQSIMKVRRPSLLPPRYVPTGARFGQDVWDEVHAHPTSRAWRLEVRESCHLRSCRPRCWASTRIFVGCRSNCDLLDMHNIISAPKERLTFASR